MIVSRRKTVFIPLSLLLLEGHSLSLVSTSFLPLAVWIVMESWVEPGNETTFSRTGNNAQVSECSLIT